MRWITGLRVALYRDPDWGKTFFSDLTNYQNDGTSTNLHLKLFKVPEHLKSKIRIHYERQHNYN